MAGVMNPFELLHGASEQLASTKKNKKANKKNAKVHGNGSVAQTAAGSNGLAASSAPLNALESCSQLEKAAKTHTRGPERLKLWDSWVSQAEEASSLTFRQVFLQSHALELVVESCLAGPLSAADERALRALLTALLPDCDVATVLDAVTQLAALQAAQSASDGCLFAAQRALHDLLALLRQASLAECSSDDEAQQLAGQVQLERVDQELVRHGKALQVLVQDGSAVSKKHLDAAKHMVKLHSDRLELFDQMRGASGSKLHSARERAARSLGELKAAISASRQDTAAAQSNAGDQMSAAAISQEAARLAQQETQLNADIRALEHQLQLLKQQAAQVSERRQQLLQRQGGKGKGAGAGSARQANGAAGNQSRLQSLGKVCALLEAACPCPAVNDAGNDARIVAAMQYLAAVRQLLGMQLASLTDMPERIKFCKQRLDKAQKLHALNASSTKANAAGGMAKQVADATALLSDSMAATEDAMLRTDQLVDAARRKLAELGATAQLQADLQDLAGIQAGIRACYSASVGQAS